MLLFGDTTANGNILLWLFSKIHKPKIKNQLDIPHLALRERLKMLSYTWQHSWTLTQHRQAENHWDKNHRKLITSNKMTGVTKIGVSFLGTEVKKKKKRCLQVLCGKHSSPSKKKWFWNEL